MDNEKVPEWALERAVDLYHQEPLASSDIAVVYKHALARYIAEREEPPVDPLLEEAINLVINDETERSDRQNDAIRKSGMASKQVRAALNGLRRGIELARKESSHAG